MTRKIGYHHFFIALGAILLGIALINVLVDPFGVFQLGSIAGFNQYKRQSFSNGVRALKSAQLVFGKYDLVILGSSRAEVGFSRDTPALKGLKTFNGGLPADNIREIIAVMNFIRRHRNTKHIFIGLDFFSFNTGAAVHSDFPDSLFSDDNLASFYLKRALSWRALVASYLTAAQNYHGETCQVFEDGFAQWPLDRLPLDKIKRILRQFIHSLSLYKRYKYESVSIQHFEEAIAECHRDGIKVDICILPVHVLLLELKWQMRLWPTYVQWKLDLVKMADRLHTITQGSFPAQVLDFSSYDNKIIYDDIYGEDLKRPLRYFWDPAHFTPLVGDHILGRILAPDKPGKLLTEYKLDRTNIAEFIRMEEAIHHSLVRAPDSPLRILDSL